MIKSAKPAIPFVIWRNGRARLEPSPSQRKLGFKGRDLKHQNGIWFSYEEAVAASLALQAEAAAYRQLVPAANRRHPVKTQQVQLGGGRTLCEIVDDFFKLPECQGKPMIDGKRIRKPLSSVTVAGYERYAHLVERASARMAQRLKDDDTWTPPVALLGPARLQNLINEIEIENGLHQARKARGFLSTLWTKIGAKQPGALKGLFLELDKMPVPDGRIRPWEAPEFWHMVHTAEAMNRFDVADMLFWGLLHGDRPTDRINPVVIERTSTHITLKHSKTGVVTKKLLDPWLQARFAANVLRREAHKVHWPHLIIDEKARRPWHTTGNHYAHVFAAIRAEAAKTMPSLLKSDSNLGIRDQDLRDTNQTWADRASIDPATIALMAGHSLGNKSDVQNRHYIARNQQKLDNTVMALSHMLTKSAPQAAREIEG